MKILHFIKELADSDEEFIEIIKEMNTWLGGNDEEINGQSLYVPNYHGRHNFTRDEHRNALQKAAEALQNASTYQQNQSNNAQHRTRESSGNSSLLW